MPEVKPFNPEEARQELAEHIEKEAKKNPRFFEKHDQRIVKETPNTTEKNSN